MNEPKLVPPPPPTSEQMETYRSIKAKYELQKKLKWYYEFRNKYDDAHPKHQKRLTTFDGRRILRMDAEPDNGWVTIKGTHVLIDDKGNVVGGPANLKGKIYANAKSVSRIELFGEDNVIANARKSFIDYEELSDQLEKATKAGELLIKARKAAEEGDCEKAYELYNESVDAMAKRDKLYSKATEIMDERTKAQLKEVATLSDGTKTREVCDPLYNVEARREAIQDDIGCSEGEARLYETALNSYTTHPGAKTATYKEELEGKSTYKEKVNVEKYVEDYIEKAPKTLATEDSPLYRGVNVPMKKGKAGLVLDADPEHNANLAQKVEKKYKVGSTISVNGGSWGFASWTPDKETTETFTDDASSYVNVRFKCTKSKSTASINHVATYSTSHKTMFDIEDSDTPMSGGQNQYEVLSPKGASFKVKSITKRERQVNDSFYQGTAYDYEVEVEEV